MQHACSPTTHIITVAKHTVITGCTVKDICTASRTVTHIICAHITITAAGCTRRVKTAVRVFLTGFTLRFWAGWNTWFTELTTTNLRTVTKYPVVTLSIQSAGYKTQILHFITGKPGQAGVTTVGTHICYLIAAFLPITEKPIILAGITTGLAGTCTQLSAITEHTVVTICIRGTHLKAKPPLCGNHR
jgi:hypothetical protein